MFRIFSAIIGLTGFVITIPSFAHDQAEFEGCCGRGRNLHRKIHSRMQPASQRSMPPMGCRFRRGRWWLAR